MSLRAAPSFIARAASMLCWRMRLVRACRSPPAAHGAHDQLLGRHERQLVRDAPADARRMHLEAARRCSP